MIDFKDSYKKQLEDCKAFIEEHGIESFIHGWTPDSVGSAIIDYIKKMEAAMKK